MGQSLFGILGCGRAGISLSQKIVDLCVGVGFFCIKAKVFHLLWAKFIIVFEVKEESFPA